MFVLFSRFPKKLSPSTKKSSQFVTLFSNFFALKEVFQLKPLRIESQPALHSQFFFRLCSNCNAFREINRTQFRLRSQKKSCFVYFLERKVHRKSKCSKNFFGFFCSKTLLLRLISQRKSFFLSLYEMGVIKPLAASRIGRC